MHMTLVTGNAGKLAEWQRLVPAGITLESVDVDLDEIQTLNLEALIADKAKRAYAMVGSPVIVEDISAGLESLGGLPGPFMKFFEKIMGPGAMYKLTQGPGERAIVHCTAAYYDGSELISVQATVRGTAVAPRGEHGFGFDKVFQIDGQTKTYGEMTIDEKDAAGHRGQAARMLFEKISSKPE